MPVFDAIRLAYITTYDIFEFAVNRKVVERHSHRYHDDPPVFDAGNYQKTLPIVEDA
jgi:hypothetical protein